MKWVVPAVVGFIVLCFLGVVLLGMAMQESSRRRMAQQATAYPVGGYSVTGHYRGVGPEWDKLTEAENKGPDGYADLQALMVSTDTDVALEASALLAGRHETEAHDLLFEQLPNVDQYVIEGMRSDWYDTGVIQNAAVAVANRRPETWKGGLKFLNLCYMRDSHSDEAFKTVVGAIPSYSGSEADDLAYTIGLFRPRSHQPLIDLLDSESERVRKTAVTALGKIGAQSALDRVKELRNDPSSSVRAAAATAEASIATATTSSSGYAGGYGYEDSQAQFLDSERSSARKRLGMP